MAMAMAMEKAMEKAMDMAMEKALDMDTENASKLTRNYRGYWQRETLE